MPALETLALGGTILSSLLSIAASIKQLIQKGTAKDFDDAVEKYKSTAPSESVALLNEEENLNSVYGLVNTIISPSVLEQLSQEAEECEEVYVKDRRDANGDPIKLRGADKRVKKCVCKRLERIMDLNDDDLPDSPNGDKDALRKLFISHDCG